MRKALILLLAVCSLAIGAPAFADTFNWTYSGGPDFGSGTFTTTALSGGQATILGITGTFDGSSITGLLADNTCCSSPANDNILYFPTAPYLDINGIGFGFLAGTLDVNIYYCNNSTGCVLGTGYTVLTAPSGSAPNGYTMTSTNGRFTVVQTPEPATMTLLGSGLLALFISRRKKLA
jgi:hypothetical protein